MSRVGSRRPQDRATAARGVRFTGGGHDVVARSVQCRGEYGADATRADDAHPVGVRHLVKPFVPIPPTTLG